MDGTQRLTENSAILQGFILADAQEIQRIVKSLTVGVYFQSIADYLFHALINGLICEISKSHRLKVKLCNSSSQVSKSATSTPNMSRKAGKIPRHILNEKHTTDMKPKMQRRNSNPNMILGRSDVTEASGFRSRTRSADVSLVSNRSVSPMQRSKSMISEKSRTRSQVHFFL